MANNRDKQGHAFRVARSYWACWLAATLTACTTASQIDSSEYPIFDITPTLVSQLKQQDDLLAAAKVAAEAKTAQAPRPQEYAYRVNSGDSFNFRLSDGFENPDIMALWGGTGQFTLILVETDGTATFPYAGKMPVKGKTIGEVREALNTALKKYFKMPHFDIQLQEQHGSHITLTGAINKPGPQYLTTEPLLISRALSNAGGPGIEADLTQAALIHADGTRETINVLGLLYSGDKTQDRILLPGDTLLLPETHRNRVFLMGDALKPGVLTIKNEKLSLTEALNELPNPNTDSQGPNNITATIGDIYVIRGAVSEALAEGGPATSATAPAADQIKIYRLDSSTPMAYAVADRFLLKPRDVIFVSAAPVTEWHRFITQLLPGNVSASVSTTSTN